MEAGWGSHKSAWRLMEAHGGSWSARGGPRKLVELSWRLMEAHGGVRAHLGELEQHVRQVAHAEAAPLGEEADLPYEASCHKRKEALLPY